MNKLIDPDGSVPTQSTLASSLAPSQQRLPNSDQPTEWKDIKSSYRDPSCVPRFTNARMLNYFVTCTVSDGLQASDFKGMNQSAENLFLRGHVQRIEVGTGKGASSTIWVRADCLPEMKKDRIYKVILCLNDQVFDIVEAQCGCPAGKGPTTSCKHIGACIVLRSSKFL